MTKQESKWIKFYPSLDLPKERVSIAYDTHDERGYRFAYGRFQFYNGTCGCFWKDGNERPKVVKAEDIKYWMPVPSLAVQEEPLSDDLEEAVNEIVNKAIPPLAQKHKDGTYVYGIRDYFNRKKFIDLVKAGALWQKEQIIKRLCNHANIDQMVEKFEDKYKPEKVFDTEYYKRGIFDTIKTIKED